MSDVTWGDIRNGTPFPLRSGSRCGGGTFVGPGFLTNLVPVFPVREGGVGVEVTCKDVRGGSSGPHPTPESPLTERRVEEGDGSVRREGGNFYD